MNNKKILGGILGSFDETEYEKESSIVSTIVQGVGEVLKSTASSVKEAIKFSSGSIDFKNTPAQNEQLQEEQKKAASIPSPAKQPSAMEGAFEGRSGTQGSGSANLSNQAVG